MHNYEHGLPHGPDPVPPLLAVDHAILIKDKTWVGKYARCDFKIDASVLFRV